MLKLPKIGKLITGFKYTIKTNNNLVYVNINFNSHAKNITLSTDSNHQNINTIYNYVSTVLTMALATHTVEVKECKDRSYVHFTVKGVNNTMNNSFSGSVN